MARDLDAEAAEVLRALRLRGKTVEESLVAMTGKGLGIIPVMKALRDVEGMTLREALDLMERLGGASAWQT
ncbi:MAG: hypothetical protein QM765_40865 [Myxococcales bacterium]